MMQQFGQTQDRGFKMFSRFHGMPRRQVATELEKAIEKTYNHATGWRTTAQAVTTAATEAAPQAMLFSGISVLSGTGITLNSATGEITLPAGVFMLSGGVGSAGVTNQIIFQWFSGSSAIGRQGAVFCPTWTATTAQFAGPAVALIKVDTTAVVRLCAVRVLTNTNVGGQVDGTKSFPDFIITQQAF